MNPRQIVAKLVRMAKAHAKTAREFPRSRDYWRGVVAGYLDAARDVAHESYGLHYLAARHRNHMARLEAK